MNYRDGRSFAGGDSNVWLIENFDASGNRRWRDYDNSFLCTIEIGGHGADNGLVVGAIPTVVSHGGYRYSPVNGKAAAAAITAPAGSADTAIWLCMGPGGVATGLNIPAWTSGMAIREGGGGLAINANSRKVYVAPYREGGQGPMQVYAPTRVISPQADVRGTGSVDRVNTSGTINWDRLGALDVAGNGITLGNGSPGVSYYLQITDALGNYITLIPNGSDFAFGVYNGGPTFFELTGEATSRNVGKRRLNFPFGFGNGDLNEQVGTAAPTSGAYAQGDRVRNSTPAVGSPKAWVCTVGGTPGTWVSEGNL